MSGQAAGSSLKTKFRRFFLKLFSGYFVKVIILRKNVAISYALIASGLAGQPTLKIIIL